MTDHSRTFPHCQHRAAVTPNTATVRCCVHGETRDIVWPPVGEATRSPKNVIASGDANHQS